MIKLFEEHFPWLLKNPDKSMELDYFDLLRDSQIHEYLFKFTLFSEVP